jgi:myo-inositol 2-dehydrogenase / D-chiro-inositol 1-dehydrogenase
VAPVFMVLETTDGQLVNIEINNNAAYGYDVRAELVGEIGTIAMNPVAYTRSDMALAQSTRYDADWRGRYAWDGYAAASVAEAGVRALHEGRKIPVKMITRPEFYA